MRGMKRRIWKKKGRGKEKRGWERTNESSGEERMGGREQVKGIERRTWESKETGWERRGLDRIGRGKEREGGREYNYSHHLGIGEEEKSLIRIF